MPCEIRRDSWTNRGRVKAILEDRSSSPEDKAAEIICLAVACCNCPFRDLGPSDCKDPEKRNKLSWWD